MSLEDIFDIWDRVGDSVLQITQDFTLGIEALCGAASVALVPHRFDVSLMNNTLLHGQETSGMRGLFLWPSGVQLNPGGLSLALVPMAETKVV